MLVSVNDTFGKVLGGGLGDSFKSPPALLCPHPPDPRSQSALPGGKGEIFSLFRRGLAPPAPLH